MSEEQQSKSGCTWLQVIVAFGVLALLISGAMPVHHPVGDRALQSATAGNCRQIAVALMLYADDHGGAFPDSGLEAKTSNDAFRVLIREGVLEDERVFGAKVSKYTPDSNIGGAPDFAEALEAGENHWTMTKGVTAISNPKTPLVFENPIVASWPPKWNCDAAGKREKGRAWRGGKIIVGFKDGTAEIIRLESAKGSSVLPARAADGKDIFTRAADHMDVLDILE